ncbi:MAG: GH13_30 / GH13_23 / GH13_31 / GH13_17 / GH13_ 40 / GH13 / GH13_29 / GH13_36 / GH13_16 / GH13_35 / G H13_20 / GH13_4 / GH13_2 / GH13_21 / GH13_1 / GH13 _26 / GH13_34 / GH13_19 [uncultured Blastococcus sp.]|uniref:GH13_30 / GH13_23 / GH13_31 / GH13_17 / GH13_ 40 / GH13 / GH13_29 / GH13_36 / GH13_16 / GH13_35 / G H13_20 / GH13_4 / GH13_2 / GH13_21 / GH13_1 / GH13 _26 / GH13_34 / GH13_19 n=1 Tax=uncultured Blastococcus sp. TaxID=217144 RepID=A0A6J4HW74_9ACTN|nr:MAG: GH13_30 / GH13_23 / GH13_31 / GH13_17 / GH13_ 40 / GH13 / GH13_29 / GH13_36 / GH13_16 / GH13_35 / G H13_20 / GH13_4 / GH13_2 / GH13_21 / GH13_1 / GH13 _26 / GH13_34 / GH13_19 [uncultured Blastococcus sp.]
MTVEGRRPSHPSQARREPPDRAEWWRDAVFYQVYVRSFADGNGDGVGDLAGIRGRLRYLADLGADALWITPFYPSPMADHGYDVADPRDVEPLFGDLAEFDALLADAHALGLRVTIDLVPNHTSDRHEWFQAALAAAPGSPERARYLFRDGRGPDGGQPPNNWPSVFGGPAWTRAPDGQWYLHIFAPEQPDLDFENPEVLADLEATMRFWLDRGVDGFRIDVAHGMAKPAGLPDMEPMEDTGLLDDHGPMDLRFDRDGVHAVHRRIRAVVEEYPDRMAVGEVWVSDDTRLARYLREDELQLAFNFKLLTAEWAVDDLRDAVTHSLAAVGGTPAPACWVLSNHDRPRHVTRYGDGPLGLRRARAAALLQLALPGAAYLYNGDELGMPDVDLPDEALQDPIWERSGHTERGRDACRIPMPWSGTAPSYGFSSRPDTWLPMPEGWGALTADAQEADPGSMQSLYRSALALRASSPAVAGDDLTWLPAPEGCLAFRRPGGLVCLVNLSGAAVRLPEGRVLLASADVGEGFLPYDAAVWLLA